MLNIKVRAISIDIASIPPLKEHSTIIFFHFDNSENKDMLKKHFPDIFGSDKCVHLLTNEQVIYRQNKKSHFLTVGDKKFELIKE